MDESPDIYERCQQFSRSDRPEVLDDLLEITFTHVPSHTLLRRMRFHIWADEATARWIASHPTFSRGCWPLGIFVLHDWMWEKKFVEVTEKEIVLGGGDDPRIGKTYIRAELENFEPGAWVAPLVNIANTHLYDQLSQFYKGHPEAKPTTVRIPTIIAEEKRKRVVKQNEMVIAQMARRHLIKRPQGEVRIFIDESGDIGFQQINDVYVLAPIIVPAECYTDVRQSLDSLRSKHWGGQPPAEIHMVNVPESKRAVVRADLAEIIRTHQLSVLGCIISKVDFIKHLFRCHAAARAEEEIPLNLTWLELIEDKEYYLQANTLATTVEIIVLHLTMDLITNGTTGVFTHDRKHRAWMNRALKLGFERGIQGARKISEAFFGIDATASANFTVMDSGNEPCLWLSDWISNELRGWCHHSSFSPELESIKPHMTFLGFSDDGTKCLSKEMGGKVEQKFPDIPRLLIRGDPADADNGQS